MRLTAVFCITCCLFPILAYAQGSTHLGVQVTPLAIGTLDVQVEQRLTKTISLNFATGFRTQKIDRKEPRVILLSDFFNQSNSAAFLSMGLRLFNPDTGEDYPYVQFGLTGLWYRDRFFDRSGHPSLVSDVAWGPSATIGYIIHANDAWEVDLGLQMGYSPPRTDLLAYYYPGLGYSTFGLGKYGVKGGHVQPVITVKYRLRMDRRERLYEVE